MNVGKIENKYLKVLVAAQRSKQLRNGARPLVRLIGPRATRIALEEVGQGLIGFDFKPVDISLKNDGHSRAELSKNDGEGDRAVDSPPPSENLGD